MFFGDFGIDAEFVENEAAKIKPTEDDKERYGHLAGLAAFARKYMLDKVVQRRLSEPSLTTKEVRAHLIEMDKTSCRHMEKLVGRKRSEDVTRIVKDAIDYVAPEEEKDQNILDTAYMAAGKIVEVAVAAKGVEILDDISHTKPTDDDAIRYGKYAPGVTWIREQMRETIRGAREEYPGISDNALREKFVEIRSVSKKKLGESGLDEFFASVERTLLDELLPSTAER